MSSFLLIHCLSFDPLSFLFILWVFLCNEVNYFFLLARSHFFCHCIQSRDVANSSPNAFTTLLPCYYIQNRGLLGNLRWLYFSSNHEEMKLNIEYLRLYLIPKYQRIARLLSLCLGYFIISRQRSTSQQQRGADFQNFFALVGFIIT